MKNKAVFLDRDGVINIDVKNYTWRIEDFHFLPGVFETCITLQEKGYLIIVITNQGGIAKGLYSHEDVEKLHAYMLKRFSENNVNITNVYYCPHHNSVAKCLCRKPGSLMVEKAIARYNIDPVKCWFVGDRQRDIDAGGGAGVKGILVDENDDLSKILSLVK
jgi:D-glycero-D-manno-heptose 1,7-bisphosphate phosphatase